jgi:transposase
MIDGSDGRRLTAAARARLVAAALKPGVHVAGLARRYGVSASSLYAWRRAVRGRDDGIENRLVPVVIDDGEASTPGASASPGEIEIALPGSVRIIVRGAVEAERLRAVLAALA